MDFSLIQTQRSHFQRAAEAIGQTVDITSLPVSWWAERTQYYLEAWKWFSGDALKKQDGTTKEGEPILRFPLQIGVRNIFRKHVSILFGEVIDAPIPQVRTLVVPKKPFFKGDKPNDAQKELAYAIQQTVNEIWIQSGGRSIEQQNALLSQFLGGHIFQIKYVPYRTDLRIPILITQIPPDWFFPVWSEDDKYDLLEAFIVYNIPGATAKHQYGVDNTNDPLVTYVEHWTKDRYSIYVGGKPLILNGLTYKDLPNPFGVVPMVYIPHLREDSWFGNGHLEDIVGILLEINARMSDQGMAIKTNTGRTTYVSNLTGNPTRRNMPGGKTAVDLGMGSPGLPEPKVTWEEPIEFKEGFSDFAQQLDQWLMRESHLNELSYGENEGSQRSAVALAAQMWPSTAHGRQERSFWNDGKIYILKIMMAILIAHPELQKKIYGKVLITREYASQIDVYLDWMPQVPRDREVQLNELVLRLQSDAIPIENAVEYFGDIQDTEWAIQQIKDWMLFKAEINQKSKPPATKVETPVASTNAGADE